MAKYLHRTSLFRISVILENNLRLLLLFYLLRNNQQQFYFLYLNHLFSHELTRLKSSRVSGLIRLSSVPASMKFVIYFWLCILIWYFISFLKLSGLSTIGIISEYFSHLILLFFYSKFIIVSSFLIDMILYCNKINQKFEMHL